MQNEWTTRTRTARVDVDTTTTRPPGRKATWTAEAGHWRADGPTEKDATAALTAGLRAFLAVYRPPSLLAFRGYVAVVSPDLRGGADSPLSWDQRIVHPDGHTSNSLGGAESWDEAEAHARYALAHHATDWHDNASVWGAAEYLEGGQRYDHGHYGPADLLRYAAWQRAARAATDAGMDANDSHAWACEHAAEHAVPEPATADATATPVTPAPVPSGWANVDTAGK
jgi:hypothetical protein